MSTSRFVRSPKTVMVFALLQSRVLNILIANTRLHSDVRMLKHCSNKTSRLRSNVAREVQEKFILILKVKHSKIDHKHSRMLLSTLSSVPQILLALQLIVFPPLQAVASSPAAECAFLRKFAVVLRDHLDSTISSC